jgi:hypothetical protein
MHEHVPGLRGIARTSPDAGWVDWFRDEVALDFPSLAEAAGRMRSAFLAADQTTATYDAELCLAPAAARAGQRVSVDLLLRLTCPCCAGRGEVWDEPCAGCSGRGDGEFPHQVQVVLPAGVRDGACYLINVPLPAAASARVALRVRVAA